MNESKKAAQKRLMNAKINSEKFCSKFYKWALDDLTLTAPNTPYWVPPFPYQKLER